jgi:hypothetical protein
MFAMAFYQWVWIELNFTYSKYNTKTYYYWINLLYLKEDTPGSKYQNFSTAKEEICGNDIYCKSTFLSL